MVGRRRRIDAYMLQLLFCLKTVQHSVPGPCYLSLAVVNGSNWSDGCLNRIYDILIIPSWGNGSLHPCSRGKQIKYRETVHEAAQALCYLEQQKLQDENVSLGLPSGISHNASIGRWSGHSRNGRHTVAWMDKALSGAVV
jgi:hypothetical protein